MPLAHIKRAFTATEIVASLAKLDGWRLSGDGADIAIEKTFTWTDFAQTMAFANAVAWLAQTHNHHPDMRIQFDRCVVRCQTHDVSGLSKADFEAAGRIDAWVNATTASGVAA